MPAKSATIVSATSRYSGFSSSRRIGATLALAGVLTLAGCSTVQTIDTIAVDRAQGSEENIASLSSVIQSAPQNPEGYNVRGSAYGRAGEFKRALEDFNRAIQLNPQFSQADRKSVGWGKRVSVRIELGGP